jgi:hypothetical protein
VPDDYYLTASLGVDLRTFCKLGDILSWGIKSSTDCYSTVAIPAIHVELNGWTTRTMSGSPPSGWLEIPSGTGEAVWWSFNPTIDPDGGGTWNYSALPYVEIAGALVTDEPHYDDSARCGSVGQLWSGNENEQDAGNPARWTEIHPPDSIRSVPFSPPRIGSGSFGSLQAIAVLSADGRENTAEVTFSYGPGTYPAGVPPQVEEFVGPESALGTVTTGNATHSGAAIDVSVTSDGTTNVLIRVGVTGRPGSPGKFKAVYRAYWA